MGDVTLEQAYEKWSAELVRYATALIGPHDAPDVVSDAFVALLGRSESWDAVRDHRAFLYVAVLNQVRMRVRSTSRRERRERYSGSLADAGGELLGDPEVRRALARLSVQQRAMVFLTYWADQAPHQVAALLGVSDGSVRRQLARARATLREVLG